MELLKDVLLGRLVARLEVRFPVDIGALVAPLLYDLRADVTAWRSFASYEPQSVPAAKCRGRRI
jgi:hypothetical protein